LCNTRRVLAQQVTGLDLSCRRRSSDTGVDTDRTHQAGNRYITASIRLELQGVSRRRGTVGSRIVHVARTCLDWNTGAPRRRRRNKDYRIARRVRAAEVHECVLDIAPRPVMVGNRHRIGGGRPIRYGDPRIDLDIRGQIVGVATRRTLRRTGLSADASSGKQGESTAQNQRSHNPESTPSTLHSPSPFALWVGDIRPAGRSYPVQPLLSSLKLAELNPA
jgi:hypothetical protein